MSKQATEERMEIWRKLEESGIPLLPLQDRVGVNRRWLGDRLVIEQVGKGSGLYNRIFEIEGGAVGYVLSVSMRNDIPGETFIMDWSLKGPWDDPFFGWLPAPEDESADALYLFPGPSAEHYARDKVLNHKMKRAWQRGVPREGFLLGVGRIPPPPTYQSGSTISVWLKLMDQYDRIHSAPFDMSLQRCEISRRTSRQENRRRVGLFECRDAVHSRDKELHPL